MHARPRGQNKMSVRLRSVMPEQREQNDDRQWHAEQPKQNSTSETHLRLSFKILDLQT
jgi:hypothetical protein